MTEEQKPPEKPARVIKNVDHKPCGCRITEYSDGVKMIAPCVPCGLNAAAEALHAAGQNFAASLSNAAQALAAVATTIKVSQLPPSAALEDAVRKAAAPRLVT